MPSHDIGHVERVVRLAKYIAEREGADVEVVVTAAKLHDIARNDEGNEIEKDRYNHAIRGAEIARKILSDRDPIFVEKVAHCIEAHSFSSGIEPKTLEAKVLSDADKLDAMGAIGVARAFLYSGEKGRSIEETLEHFEEKLLKLMDNLYTRTAKELAEKKYRFLKYFYSEILKELNFNLE